ncbi:fructuronate reductase [Brenneria roseae subsp. roseae]|uniref:mannitol dehydrogenase family protein n=1 Tax=Brenneria roseae TaxID=1509241 RepID=UPI000D610801|nr:fructuronate reductase [Brenneria roseae]PWC21233.1 fructuronate reductase [Brenneria roseae subsp. roseae]
MKTVIAEKTSSSKESTIGTSANAAINIATHPLPAEISQPRYDRKALKSRIVHIGFGAFHRAHQALFTDRVLNQQGGDWGICEVNLFGSENLFKSLRQQAHRYSVLEKGAGSHQAIIIGSVNESLHARLEGITAVIEKLAEPQVAIVSMTVTEKGYCIDRSTGNLDRANPLIKMDLEMPDAPASAPGVLVEALRVRRERGLPPFTLLSCDNMPENGHILKSAVLELAQLRSTELASWIEMHASFPNTMVDRIVPAATPETLQEIADTLGINDPCGIACEPFIQWVVEDNFVAGRPAWELAGAQLVDDVLPFEEMKLRMLNGSHSFLAYLGYLAGYQHINDCMTDDNYRRAAHYLMLNEQAPTLRVTGVDLADYADRLITRYENPSLQHRTWQIAMDGTQKLPQRMLDSIRWHLRNGSDYRCLLLGVAGWIRYVSGTDDAGQAIDIRDPMAEQLQAIVSATEEGEPRVRGLLALTAVFGEDLPQNEAFVAQLIKAYQTLQTRGAKAAVAELF